MYRETLPKLEKGSTNEGVFIVPWPLMHGSCNKINEKKILRSVNNVLDPTYKNMHNVKYINNKSFMRTLSHARSDKTLHKNKTRTKILL